MGDRCISRSTPSGVLAVIVALVISAAAFMVAIPTAYAATGDTTALKAGTLSIAGSNDVEYYIDLPDLAYVENTGAFGVPGEKMTLKAATVQYNSDTWERKNVRGVTYKWKASKKLKATPKASKLVIAKLPKAGKYPVTVTSYSKKTGKKLASLKFKVVVKKKPGTVIKVRTITSKGKMINNAKTVQKGDTVHFLMANAYWSWDNNTKKSFYSWQVTNLKTKKTAKWNSKNGTFKKNAFIGGGSVGGADTPIFMGEFKAKGKYRITAYVYHSNKLIEKVSKTITVK